MNHGSVGLGYRAGWGGGVLTEGGQTTRQLTARGVASPPTPARGGIGKVAERVNRAVEALPGDLQRVVRLHYCEAPWASGAEKADVLGVSLRSFHRYVHRSHEAISGYLPESFVGWSPKYPQARK